MPQDLFTQLDKELEEMKEEIFEDMSKTNQKKAEIVKNLIEDFWNIWIRFDAIPAHFTMEPPSGQFATFEEYPKKWRFKDNFRFEEVHQISLTDRTQRQGRLGDSIKATFYNVGKDIHLRVVFEYCEGEHYYKYSGWKRIFAQQIIYDASLQKVNMNKLWERLSDVVKVWFESHLRRNRDIIIKYVKENFEKGETFTE